jgi:hypothetical protein
LQKNVFADNSAVMAKVDADSTPGGQALGEKFNVTGLPTLIWFVNGKPQPYDGPSNWAQTSYTDIVFWVVSKTDVNTQTLTEKVKPTPPHSKTQSPTLKSGMSKSLTPKRVSLFLPPSETQFIFDRP